MKFAVLAAGIDMRRKIDEQALAEVAPAERGVELFGVDAAEDRAVTPLDEVACETRCVFAPERKHAAPAEPREHRFAVCAHVGEKKIAECDRVDRAAARCARVSERIRERGFVDVVARLRRDFGLDQRQTESIDLPNTIMRLQMQQVGYEAALSATSKALQPTLLDYLR